MIPPVPRSSVACGGAGFFLLGLVSLLAQTVLVREALFAFHGGEIGLGLFFAMWLAGIAVGATGGAAWLRTRAPTPEQAGGWFQLGLSMLTWAALAQIAVWRFHRALLPVDAGGYLPALAYLLLLVPAAMPVALITGLFFPVGLRAWPIPPGRAYALESLGSMVGAAAAALLALPRMPHMAVAALGVPAVLLWLVWSGAVWLRRARYACALGLAVAATLCLVVGVWSRLDAAAARMRWDLLGTGTKPVVQLETAYHQVTVAALDTELSLYLDGLYEGALDDPYADSLTAAAILTQHPAPRRVLLLTPGFYGAARVMAGARGVSLEIVRADAGVDRAIELALRQVRCAGPSNAVWAAPGSATVVTADPRATVRSVPDPLDLIAVMHGDATTGAANRLYTREFFAICARALDPAGVLAIALPGAANVEATEGLALRNATCAALRESFADVRLAPGTTYYFFASRPLGASAMSPLSWQPDSLAARRARLWPSGRPWPSGTFAALYPADRVEALARRLAGDGVPSAPPNSDRRPTAYYQQLRRWDRFSGSGLGPWLDAWHAAPWPWSLGLLGLLAALGFWLRRRWGQPAVCLASTGMAGMGASLLVLLVFQTSLGTLYLQVGLVSAVFMAGLGLGSMACARGLERAGWQGAGEDRAGAEDLRAPPEPTVPVRLLAASDAAWVLALIGLVPLTAAIPSWPPALRQASLLALAGLTGLLTGAPFPLVAAALRARGATWAVAGGIADAADNAGAIFGALLTGTLLVPLLGFTATLGLLAAVKALSLASALARR
jgi:spermidine synthase